MRNNKKASAFFECLWMRMVNINGSLDEDLLFINFRREQFEKFERHASFWNTNFQNSIWWIRIQCIHIISYMPTWSLIELHWEEFKEIYWKFNSALWSHDSAQSETFIQLSWLKGRRRNETDEGCIYMIESNLIVSRLIREINMENGKPLSMCLCVSAIISTECHHVWVALFSSSSHQLLWHFIVLVVLPKPLRKFIFILWTVILCASFYVTLLSCQLEMAAATSRCHSILIIMSSL